MACVGEGEGAPRGGGVSGRGAVQRNTVQRHWLGGPPTLRLWSAAPTRGPLRQPHRFRAQGVLTCDTAFSESRRLGCQRNGSEWDTGLCHVAATRAVPTAHQSASLGSPACSQARVPLWHSACPKGRKATTCPFMTRWRQPKQELCWPQLRQS